MTYCFCGAPVGSNRHVCYYCRAYYELTSDYGRELIDADESGNQLTPSENRCTNEES